MNDDPNFVQIWVFFSQEDLSRHFHDFWLFNFNNRRRHSQKFPRTTDGSSGNGEFSPRRKSEQKSADINHLCNSFQFWQKFSLNFRVCPCSSSSRLFVIPLSFSLNFKASWEDFWSSSSSVEKGRLKIPERFAKLKDNLVPLNIKSLEIQPSS